MTSPDSVLLLQREFRNLARNWDLMVNVENRAIAALSVFIRSPAMREIIGKATTELLDNVSLYNDWNHSVWPSFEVKCFEGPLVELTTRNRVALTSPHVERFSTAIAQLRDPRSAEAFREQQTAATLAAGIEAFGSTGLGLVRIACQGHGQIEGDIDSDGVVTTRVQLDQEVLLKRLREKQNRRRV